MKVLLCVWNYKKCTPSCVSMGLIGLLLATHCSSKMSQRPRVALAQSTESETRFSNLKQRLMTATLEEKKYIHREWVEFLEWVTQRKDTLEPLVRAYVGISWLESNIPAAAEATVRPLIEGAPGVAQDLAYLVKGAAARRQGRFVEATETLQLISGKLIDTWPRFLFFEEMVEALIAQERFDEALIFMDGWFRMTLANNENRIRLKIAKALGRVPTLTLSQLLESSEKSQIETGYSQEFLFTIEQVLERKNLEPTENSKTASKENVPVIVPRFDPYAVALLLPSSDVRYSSIATQIRQNILQNAAAVRTNTSAQRRWIVLDTAGTESGTRKALEVAQQEGAAILLGGVTDIETNVLTQRVQVNHQSAIVFRNPVSKSPSESKYWVSLRPSNLEELTASLAVAATLQGPQALIIQDASLLSVASIQSSVPRFTMKLTQSCNTDLTWLEQTQFPIESWAQQGVSTVTLFTDFSCANQWLKDAQKNTKFRPHLVLTPSMLEFAYSPVPFARTVLLPTARKKTTLSNNWWAMVAQDALTIVSNVSVSELKSSVDSSEIHSAQEQIRKQVRKAFSALQAINPSSSGPKLFQEYKLKPYETLAR